MTALVGIIMGSRSDWETMRHAADTLERLGVAHEVRVVSAHRTPDLLFEYAGGAEARGSRSSSRAPAVRRTCRAWRRPRPCSPFWACPSSRPSLKGVDSLLSIVQMPGGVPVGTLAVGKAGAVNAALLAAAILGAKHPQIREALRAFRAEQTAAVLADPDPRKSR